jgi:hypothetical protein
MIAVIMIAVITIATTARQMRDHGITCIIASHFFSFGIDLLMMTTEYDGTAGEIGNLAAVH